MEQSQSQAPSSNLRSSQKPVHFHSAQSVSGTSAGGKGDTPGTSCTLNEAAHWLEQARLSLNDCDVETQQSLGQMLNELEQIQQQAVTICERLDALEHVT